MNKIQLINYLIRQRGATRLLEISLDPVPSEHAQLHCECKMLISPLTSEHFFSTCNEKYDIILIDGLHTEQQVLDDLSNSFKILQPGGIIFLHDCMPPDSWHQREFDLYKPGENWNGTVWKAGLRTFNESKYQCTLIDTDWGCGLIDTSKPQVPLNVDLPDELSYDSHYPLFLRYKTSVSKFLQRSVEVFYHLACMGNWEQVFDEQIKQLQRNGFSRMHLSVVGSLENRASVEATLENAGIEVCEIAYDDSLTGFERGALLAIEQFAQQNEGAVLYVHSKGVSNPADESKSKWRRLMMSELIDNWEQCIRQLSYYDVIGVNWREMPPISHFSGNFWYASTGYLRKLSDFRTYYDNPRYSIWDQVNNKRLGCEFWIGSANERPRVLSLAYQDVDFCSPGFWTDK